jgi:putative hydrolase of the HAD superfamily
MRYRAVIFDLWQTLVPWPAEAAKDLYGRMADAVGAPREEFKEVWLSGRTQRETGPLADSIRWVCGELGIDGDIDAVLTLRRAWTREWLVPRAGALETLTELRRRGHRQGLITVCSQDVVEAWPETPFAGLLDETVFSCEVGVSKPDPRIYQIACERLGVEPVDCLFVGDGANDELAGAERVGMAAVQLRPPDEPLAFGATEWPGRSVQSLEQVLELA